MTDFYVITETWDDPVNIFGVAKTEEDANIIMAKIKTVERTAHIVVDKAPLVTPDDVLIREYLHLSAVISRAGQVIERRERTSKDWTLGEWPDCIPPREPCVTRYYPPGLQRPHGRLEASGYDIELVRETFKDRLARLLADEQLRKAGSW